MNEAKSDLINVLSSLEAHWHVLEAEVVEINRDIEYCEQCLRKYGEWFNSPYAARHSWLRALPAQVRRMVQQPFAISARAEADEEEQNEGDHPHDGELQQQPAGRQEARQVAREAVAGERAAGAGDAGRHRDGRVGAPPARCAANHPRPRPRRRATADAALNSLLQADAPGLMVGSGLASQTQRVIKPVEA